ncbi:MAG: cell division protein FtsQ [Alphaproteobacteria bacterium]
MQTKGQKLKRPKKLQKKLVIRVLLSFVALALVYGASIVIPKVSDDVSEFVARSIDAKLEKILVTGTKNIDHKELLTSLGLVKGDSLIGFDAAAVRENIQDISWVKEAVVERQLPSTLKVTIYEYTPIARLESDDGLWLVDSNGHEINAVAINDFMHLPLLRGENAAEQAAELFGLLMSKNIKLGEQVVEARYIGDRRWDIAFHSGVWVQLPENNPEQALDILKKLDAKKGVLAMDGGVVDLRLEDRIVLRLPPHKKLKERIL